ncbi:MAG: hypothetical protein SFV51_27635 [Bryobacteraceae bacterium]|nr:hypothetical protein [Bryobacteraceae bacterium]
MGLAIRTGEHDRLDLLFRRRNMPGIRFEAARFIADHILTPGKESWLPATDAKTARQKIQRAFAAEFLCPIAALDAFLNHEYSPESIERAAEHFDVSPLAVESHLANHRRDGPRMVAAFQPGG